MAPKKKRQEESPCDVLEGEQFNAQIDDVFNYNWWEICCFPYILCGRFWDCCISLCAGGNQCLVYWMMIQWVVCKITRLTTPDPMIFPYYFYVFCQVVMLTIFFLLIWIWFGKSLLIPYVESFYIELGGKTTHAVENTTRMSFRRYCFRKSDIFDSSLDNGSATLYWSYTKYIVPVMIELYMYEII